MKKLSKEEMKKVMGGVMAGGCSMVMSDQGYSSCWYTYDPSALCHRVYGSHCKATMPVDCSAGCTLN